MGVVVSGSRKKDSMIIVKLQGGLGNQMFQYALGRTLSHIHNVPFSLDATAYAHDPLRSYALSHFRIQERFASTEDIARFYRFKKKRGKMGFLYNCFFADESRYVEERRFNFDPRILETRDDAYVDGFWQTEKYFSPIATTIREEFTLKMPLGDRAVSLQHEIERSEQSVAIHVRRADYVANPSTHAYHGVCGKEYYNRAIKTLSGRLPRPHLFIFSDDEAWARENLRYPFPTTYIPREPMKDHEDLYLMSLCRNNIVANSSFSWWGAWLNENPQKIVIAPKRWVATPKLNTADLIPDPWIILDS